jgi:hypothetical protein
MSLHMACLPVGEEQKKNLSTYSMVIKSDIVSRCIVRRIKVVSVGWELSGKCIDFLYKRCYAEILSASSNLILSASNFLAFMTSSFFKPKRLPTSSSSWVQSTMF